MANSKVANTVPVTEAPTKKEFQSRYKFSAVETAAMLGKTLVRIWQLVTAGKINARFDTDPETGRRSNILVLKSGVLQAQKLLRGQPALQFSK